MSIRRPGWLTSWPASPGIRPIGSMSCCRGIGGRARPRAAKPPDHGAISAVFTIGYVANLLGEDEDWLHDLSINMFPQDGSLWVHGVGEDGVPAFTRDGIENLRQIIADARDADRGPLAYHAGKVSPVR